MNIFKKKTKIEQLENEQPRVPWYKRTVVKLLAVATVITAVLVPTSETVFAASLYKEATSYHMDIVGESLTSASYPWHTSFYNGSPAYCINPYSIMAGTFSGSGYTGDVLGVSSYQSYGALSSDTKNRLAAITYFGYGYGGRNSVLWFAATQDAVWDTVGYSNVCKLSDLGTHNNAYTGIVRSYKSQIMADVNNYLDGGNTKASWVIKNSAGEQVASGTGAVTFDKARVGETYTITDVSGNLANSSVIQNDFGGRGTVSGNTITVKMKTEDYGISKTIKTKSNKAQTLSSRGTSVFLTSSSLQNMVTTGTPTAANGESSVTLVGYGVPIEVTKLSSVTNSYLSGATLNLYKMNGNVASHVATWTTSNENKKLDLCPGTYKLVEDDAPKGYYKSRPVTFEVKEQIATQYYSMTDEPIKLKIDKVNAKDENTGVQNAHLQLLDGNKGLIDELDWYSTGEALELPTNNLKAGGYYYIHETDAAKGYYVLEDDIMIQIPEYKPEESSLTDGYLLFNVGDMPIEYFVDKINALTTERVVGATLQLLDSNGKPIDEWVTDGTRHKIDNMLLEVGKTYSVHEVSAPVGYYVMASDVSFTVDPIMRGHEWDVQCMDYPISYGVNKIDDNGDFVDGATLALYDSEGNELDRWITSTKEGYHKLSGLSDGGKYSIKELEAPAGYYRTDTPYEFTVSAKTVADQQKDITIEFDNHIIAYESYKYDSKGKTMLSGAVFKLTDAEGNDITDENDDVVTIESSNQQGISVPSKYLVGGNTYQLVEIETPKGYYFMNESIKFTVPSTYEEAKAADKSTFTLNAKDKAIKIEIAKVDSQTKEYVAGAELAIYPTKECKPEEILYSWTTTEEPEMISDKITLEPDTTYYIREIETATGYFLNNSAVEVYVPRTVDTDKVLTFEFENVPIYWHIAKTDMDGNALTTVKDGTSFVLEVYDTNETLDNQGDDNLIATLDTSSKEYKSKLYFDMQSYIDKGLVVGGHTYRIHEKTAASGYKYSDDVLQKISLEGLTDSVISSSMSDDTFTVYINKVDQNGNELTSYTDANGKAQGFELNIYNTSRDNMLVTTIDTNSDEYKKNGYVDISEYLNSDDTYVVKEEKVPYGYYRAKDYTFNVSSLEFDGNGIAHITMTDPTVNVVFRKETANGTWIKVGSDGQGFKFSIYDTQGTDTTDDDGDPVGSIDTATDACSEDGWIDIGHFLQEGRTYRIHEIFAPTGHKVSTTDAYLTVPDYYNDQLGSVTNVKVSATTDGDGNGTYDTDY